MVSRFFLAGLGTLACLPLSIATTSPLHAQTLHLSQLDNGSTARAEASVGDTLSIQIRANLGSLSATGLTLFVRFSSTMFAAVDADGDAANGLQPFEQGSLFAGAVEFDNATVSGDEFFDAQDWQTISYAAVLGGGGRQASNGSGDVATFRLLCLQAAPESDVSIYRSPIHETRLVLSDGRTERDFKPAAPLTVSVARKGVTDAPWSSLKDRPR
jgi:hypothetical protein